MVLWLHEPSCQQSKHTPAAMAAVLSAASEAAAAAAAAALGAVDAAGMRPAGRERLPTWITPRRNVPVVSTTLAQPSRSPAGQAVAHLSFVDPHFCPLLQALLLPELLSHLPLEK